MLSVDATVRVVMDAGSEEMEFSVEMASMSRPREETDSDAEESSLLNSTLPSKFDTSWLYEKYYETIVIRIFFCY